MDAPEKIQLCINADDFGFSKPISSGILEIMGQGLVSSTSVMVQEADSENMQQLSKQNTISVGLHFNLASKKNNFTPFLNSPYAIALQFYSGKLTLTQLEKELEDQYKQLRRTYSKEITHIDTHQHIHIIPKVAALLTEFAKQVKIPYVRSGKEVSPGMGIKKGLFNYSGSSVKKLHSVAHVKDSDSDSTLKNPIPLFGLNLYGKKFTVENIKKQFQFLARHKISKAIWIVHPGYITPDLDFTDKYNKQRENEMRVLTELRDYIPIHAQVTPLNTLYAS